MAETIGIALLLAAVGLLLGFAVARRLLLDGQQHNSNAVPSLSAVLPPNSNSNSRPNSSATAVKKVVSFAVAVAVAIDSVALVRWKGIASPVIALTIRHHKP